MTRQELNAIIESSIRTNGRGEITAVVMSGVLYNLADYSDSLQASIMGALANYYLKTETYSREQVNAMIAAVRQFRYMKVDVRPVASADTVGIVYLVPSADPAVENVCDEWITVEDGEGGYAWELIGSTAVDLEGYVTDEELAAAIAGCLSGPRPVTHAQLLALRNAGTLVPGQEYRITDYVATTVLDNTQSAEHPFDIIVKAVEPQRLSETASAVPHAGDDYFEGCNMAAWRLRYAIDNEPERFEWADEEYGKGVIYEMTDEYGNTAPFDFKGIQFYRDDLSTYVYLFSAVRQDDDSVHDTTVELFKDNHDVPQRPRGNTIGPTFSEHYDEETSVECPDEEEMIDRGLCEETYNEETGEYEFICPDDPSHVCPSQQEMIDRGMCEPGDIDPETGDPIWICPDPEEYGLCENYCEDVYHYSNGRAPQTLNFIDFVTVLHCTDYTEDYDCILEGYLAPYGNTFGVYCRDIHFNVDGTYYGDVPTKNNTFGAGCNTISFAKSATSNTFGADCQDMTFGGSPNFNTFGDQCAGFTVGSGALTHCVFGKAVTTVNIGGSCSSLEVGNGSSSITIGNNCSNNKIGKVSRTCTIGNSSRYNNIGDGCSTINLGTNCEYNTIAGGCSSIMFGNYYVANVCHEQSASVQFRGGSGLAHYVRQCEFGVGVRNLELNCTAAGSSSSYIQGYKFMTGVNTSAPSKKITVYRGRAYQTNVGKNTSGTIVEFNLADLT